MKPGGAGGAPYVSHNVLSNVRAAGTAAAQGPIRVPPFRGYKGDAYNIFVTFCGKEARQYCTIANDQMTNIILIHVTFALKKIGVWIELILQGLQKSLLHICQQWSARMS